ncbi:hypothetical protein Tco_0304983 [Tanacetum coccineum]
MFEKEKLSGNNFNEWFARLKLVLRVEKKMHVIEQPLPPAPEPVVEPNVVDQWTALYDAHTKIACLMLGSMTPELHRQFELYYPFDIIQELRFMFEKQAGVEKFDLIQYFHACKTRWRLRSREEANKLKEAVDVAVQLKYDRIREEAHTKNQQFLDSIDEGMKKENQGTRSRKKEAKTSHAVAANLSELELKKILIDKMEANNSINRSDIQRQLYKALVDAYEAEKILLDTYGDTVTIKRPRDGADDDQEPSAGTDRGSKRRRSGKEPESTSAPREMTTTTAGKTTTGSKTHKQSASQSAPVEETMQSTDVFEAPAHQEFETGIHDEQAEEEVHHLPDWFQQPKRLPSPDHAWNKSVPAVHESVQPWLSNLARRQDPRESFDELTDTTFDFFAFVMNRLNVTTLTPEFLKSTKPQHKNWTGSTLKAANILMICDSHYRWFQIPQVDHVYRFTTSSNNDLSTYGNGRQISTLKNVLHICLLKNVHQKCCHQRRVEILTIGVMKALKETQPHKSLTRTISNLEYEKPYTPYSDPRRIHSMKQRQEEQ